MTEMNSAWRARLAKFRADTYLRSHALYVFAAVAVCLVMPLAFGAAILYPQPNERVAQIGKMCHLLSLVMAWIGVAYFARNSAVKFGLLLALPLANFLSSFEAIRTVYLVLITVVLGISGMIMARRFGRYLMLFVVVLGVVSLVLMALQLYGWPSWINGLATQGAYDQYGAHYELHPTLLVNVRNLKAVYWQTRPAGIFSSNQASTMFFFVLLAVTVSWRGRACYPLLFIAAAYAVLTLSKAAIFGPIAIFAALSFFAGSAYVAMGAVFLLTEAVLLSLYLLLFPGVIDTFFSPYNFLVSIAARAIDLAGAVGLKDAISIASEMGWHRNIVGAAVSDALAAFRTPGGALNYDSLGATTLYSEIARTPVASALIIMALAAVGVFLHRRGEGGAWGRPQPFDLALLSGMFIFTWVMAVGAFHVFWMCTAFGLLPIYGKLIEPPPLVGRAGSATLR